MGVEGAIHVKKGQRIVARHGHGAVRSLLQTATAIPTDILNTRPYVHTLILIFRASDPPPRTTRRSALRPVTLSQEKRSASAAHSFSVASTLKNLDARNQPGDAQERQ